MSMTTFPSKLDASAGSIASPVAIPKVANAMTSPNAAASAKVPAEAEAPIRETHAVNTGLLGVQGAQFGRVAQTDERRSKRLAHAA